MTEIIDPHGDVVLLLGGASRRLLVCSKILSVASSVFAVIFSPRFHEAEVPLLNDPPLAVETIANILHFRHSLVPTTISFDDLFDIALVADKYDLAPALGPWRQIWLRQIPECSMNADGCPVGNDRGNDEIFIRYVFTDSEGFSAATRRAVLWGKGADGGGCEALPERITKAINLARESAIATLLVIAHHYGRSYRSKRVRCKVRPTVSSAHASMCGAAILGSLIRHYSDIGIFPMPQRPYSALSVGGIAKGLKEITYFVDYDSGHAVCVAEGVAVLVDAAVEVVKGLRVKDFKMEVGEKDGGESMREAPVSTDIGRIVGMIYGGG